MRHILILALILSTCIIAAVFINLISFRQQAVISYQPIAQEFLPGQPFPPDVTCHMAYYYYEDHVDLYCQPAGDIRLRSIYITYDMPEKIIVHTDLLNPHKTVGDLILAWGDPVGYRQAAIGHYLYWPGRYAYIGNAIFSPDDNVGFISYDDAVTVQEAWRGFANSRANASK